MTSWFQALNQSFSKNQFLDYSSLLTAGVIKDLKACLFPLRFQGFFQETLTVFVDKRSAFYDCLLTQPCEVLWHFPATCEFFKLTSNVFEDNAQEARMAYWNNLTQREKQGYCGLPPDCPVVNARQLDLDRFKPQEALNVSENFAVLRIRPFEVEHSKFLDKSAVGNSRKTFESLPQPDSISRKWLHRQTESGWEITELYVPIARP